MEIARVTDRDPRLAHQIILMVSQHRSKHHRVDGAGTAGTSCAVTCNCRSNETFGFVGWDDLAGAWALYDDPENHDHTDQTFYPGLRSPTREVIVRDV